MESIYKIIEILSILIVYHIVFFNKNNIIYNILRSIGIILVLSIPLMALERISIPIILTFIIIMSIIININVNKDIIVSFVEMVVSTALVLLVQVISLVTFIVISNLFFNGNFSDEFSFLWFLIILVISLSIFYICTRSKDLDIDSFIKKYNDIIIICINTLIVFLFIRLIVELNTILNEYLEVTTSFNEYLIEFGLLSFIAISLNIIYFINKYKMNMRNKKSEIKESINPLIQELIDEMKSSEHEYKNHLNILYCMIQVCKADELKDRAKNYIGDIFENKNLLNKLSNIDNTILKAVLLSKINQAEKNNINCEHNIENHLENIPFDDSELTVVLSNLLNNAIEAANKCENAKINIYTGVYKNKNIIKVENSVSHFDEAMLPSLTKMKYSTKGEGRGFGLHNIQNIVAKYKGDLEINLNDDMLEISISV